MDATQVAEDPLPRPLAEHADDHRPRFVSRVQSLRQDRLS
jgi:hypothetical protein